MIFQPHGFYSLTLYIDHLSLNYMTGTNDPQINMVLFLAQDTCALCIIWGKLCIWSMTQQLPGAHRSMPGKRGWKNCFKACVGNWHLARVSQVAKWWRILLPMQGKQEMQVWPLGWEDPLEQEMATHSTILAWRIPWTEEPGGLQPMKSQKWNTANTTVLVNTFTTFLYLHFTGPSRSSQH